MNRWLQTKRYRCSGCGVRCLHDQMYLHVVFHCPKRRAINGKATR